MPSLFYKILLRDKLNISFRNLQRQSKNLGWRTFFANSSRAKSEFDDAKAQTQLPSHLSFDRPVVYIFLLDFG